MHHLRGSRAGVSQGFSMLELLFVIAIIGIVALITTPLFLSYLQAATVRTGAAEIQSGLNRAKQFAVTTRQNICVQLVAGGYRFLQGGCGGAAWVGLGTDTTGTFRFPNNVTATNAGTSPIFTQFGTASQTGTLTVTGPGGITLTVSVSPSGRITVP